MTRVVTCRRAVARLGAFALAVGVLAVGSLSQAQEGTRIRPGTEQAVSGSSVTLVEEVPVVRPDAEPELHACRVTV